MTTLSCADDVQLRDATGACIKAPPDLLIANTGVGMRGWFDAATRWGLGARLVESLRGCEILARGPKAVAAALGRQGSEVTVVTVYRSLPAADQAPLSRLVDLVADRDLDAVVFTAAPAVKVLMDVATAAGRKQEFLDAFRGHVIAACVGPVTAEAFGQLGIPVIQPARSRLGALAREIIVQLPARRHGSGSSSAVGDSC